MKSTSVLAMLYWLGVRPSFSMPRVGDDDAFVESLIRTVKCRTEFPSQGSTALDQARHWTARFVHWYNVRHRHSGIRYASRRRDKPTKIGRSWSSVMRCTCRRASATGNVGRATPAIGTSLSLWP